MFLRKRVKKEIPRVKVLIKKVGTRVSPRGRDPVRMRQQKVMGPTRIGHVADPASRNDREPSKLQGQ